MPERPQAKATKRRPKKERSSRVCKVEPIPVPEQFKGALRAQLLTFTNGQTRMHVIYGDD